ncbi:MAG: holo-ACP synthase [Treponema sp.]|nr:holo-ACP synthase [Treponema sp.]
MICGIGCDIVLVSRLEKWVKNEKMLNHVFNPLEMITFDAHSSSCKMQNACEHYAARFAAKEAFVKAMGTGFVGCAPKDVFVVNDEQGAPVMRFSKEIEDRLQKRFGKYFVHVSLSHERENAIAFVVIEKL